MTDFNMDTNNVHQISPTEPDSTFIPDGLYSRSEALELMNKRYFLAQEGTDHCIFMEDGSEVVSMKKEHFLQATARIKVNLGDDEKSDYKPAGSWWLSNIGGRSYTKTCFDPAGTPKGAYNYWTGFSVSPVKGDCSLMKAHMLNVLCSGNRHHFNYLMDLLAFRFQHPEIKIEVALVLKSEVEGTGKGITCKWVTEMIGSAHAITVTDPKHLVGGFNGHLARKLVILSDEAVWHGDKKASAALKSFITDKELLVENKYRTAFMSPNLSFLMITTNDTHAITAGVAARRFFVLDVSTDKAGNREYFNALADQASNGGLEAMMYELLKRDLSNFNMRDVPKTDELKDQQKMSVDTIDEWLMECCEAGILVDGTVNQYNPPSLGAWVHGGEITAIYSKWCSTNKRHKENGIVFGKHMVKLGMLSVAEAGRGNNRRGRYIQPADKLMNRIEDMLSGIQEGNHVP